MEDLIVYIARLLVDEPEAVQVHAARGRQGTVYRLSVAPKDRGKIIGKEGRIIDAIRALVEAAAARQNVHASIDIL